MRRLAGIFASLLLFGGGWLLLGGLAAGSSSDGPGPMGPTTSATPTPSETPSATPTPEACDSGDAVSDLLYDQGFESDDFVIGEDAVDWGKLPVQHVQYPFSLQILRSASQVDEFLGGDGAAAEAARNLVSGDAGEWVAVQFQSVVHFGGNWYWKNGKAVKGEEDMIAGGDVWWFKVSTGDCQAGLDDSIRAICGNVGLETIGPYLRD